MLNCATTKNNIFIYKGYIGKMHISNGYKYH